MSWRRCRLDWLTSEERGAVNPTEISADTVFHYSIPALDEIGDGRLEQPDEIGSGKLLLSGGEVLISKLNPRLPRVLLAEAHDVPTLASTEFIALRPGPNVDERFLRYWLGSEPLRQMLNGATMSVTRSQQRVRPEIVTKSWLRVPSIDDQRAIADYLDRETARIDALIEKKRRMVELLEERKWALVVESLDRVPSRSVPLRRLLTSLADGPFGSSVMTSHYSDAGIRVVRLANIGPAEFDNSDEAYLPSQRMLELNRHRVSAGDLLIAGLGDDGHPVGRACVAPDLGPAIVKADCYCGRVDTSRAVPEYLAWYLSSPTGNDEVARTGRGSTRSRINLDIARSISVLLPDLTAQVSLSRFWSEKSGAGQKATSALRAQIELLVEHRHALVTAAVSGQLDIPGVAA